METSFLVGLELVGQRGGRNRRHNSGQQADDQIRKAHRGQYGRGESEGCSIRQLSFSKKGRVDWDRKSRLFWTSCVLELRCSAVFGLFAPFTMGPNRTPYEVYKQP